MIQKLKLNNSYFPVKKCVRSSIYNTVVRGYLNYHTEPYFVHFQKVKFCSIS